MKFLPLPQKEKPLVQLLDNHEKKKEKKKREITSYTQHFFSGVNFAL
jgi:hypothetical protein